MRYIIAFITASAFVTAFVFFVVLAKPNYQNTEYIYEYKIEILFESMVMDTISCVVVGKKPISLSFSGVEDYDILKIDSAIIIK